MYLSIANLLVKLPHFDCEAQWTRFSRLFHFHVDVYKREVHDKSPILEPEDISDEGIDFYTAKAIHELSTGQLGAHSALVNAICAIGQTYDPVSRIDLLTREKVDLEQHYYNNTHRILDLLYAIAHDQTHALKHVISKACLLVKVFSDLYGTGTDILWTSRAY